MTSIERTAYPQFKRLTSARVLHVFFTPTEDEAAWAQERTETESLLALLVDLKCFQRMARFCSREEIPHAVTDHVRHCLALAPETEAGHGTDRTMRLHRSLVRKRQGATRDPRRARALAAAAIREAAQVRNHPPDLINVALERIIEASLELPAYSTLDEMAANIRTEVNEAIFAGITGRMGAEGRQRAQGLLDTAGSGGRSMFNRLKKPAQRATWSRFKAQAEYLDEVDELGDTAYWLEGVAPAKVADFAGEAAAQDIDTLSRYGANKKLALVACLAHTARMQARDDLAEMLCKRVASIVKKAKAELEEIRLRQRAVSERLIGTYRTVLENLDPDGEAAVREPGQGQARAVAAVEEAGGFAAQLSDIEEVTAYHGDNYEVLVHRFFRKDRAVMFELAAKLGLVATSSDDSVLAALQHARAYHAARRDHIPLPPADGDGEEADSGLAFASGNWRRAVTDRRRPGMVVRKHFEAMVFTYLAEELRTGDIAVADAGEYADWRANLLPWEECEPLLEGFCAGTGLPATASGFTERLRHAHLDAAAALDAGYEDNADLVIGEDGVPSLKRRRSAGTPEAAERLAEAVARRMPERSLLSITARTAYWLGWHHHFGPAGGSDPKIADPLGRYCMAVFTGGANIGPYEAARHISGVSARELSMVRNRHIDLKKLNSAIATVSTPSTSSTLSRHGATAPQWPPTAPRSRPTSTTSWPRHRSGTEAWEESHITTSQTLTWLSSPGSSRAACGRRCT